MLLEKNYASSILFFKDNTSKNQDFFMTFSAPMSKFRTFQVLKNEKSNFMTFQDQWEPCKRHKLSYHWQTAIAGGISAFNSHYEIKLINLDILKTHKLSYHTQTASGGSTLEHRAPAVVGFAPSVWHDATKIVTMSNRPITSFCRSRIRNLIALYMELMCDEILTFESFISWWGTYM